MTVLVMGLAASPAAAEELVLKDGQKIVGTIVGYENDMFRVETEYGFALVRKDRVVSVNFASATSGAAAKKQSEAKTQNASTKPTIGKPEKVAASPLADPGGTKVAASGPAPREAGATSAPVSVPPPVGSSPPAAPGPALPAPSRPPVVASPPPPPPVSKPVDEPLPPHFQEHVEGNSYTNDTFQFAMFKPPGWKVYEGVPRETGSAIVAIGTEDERTLLFVDRQAWTGPPDLKSDGAEARLRQTYQDYQKLSESALLLDGQSAVRRAFRGVVDGVEWSGVSVHVAHGNAVFGITGLTSGELVQFQEALFMKIINSFHFLALTSKSGPLPPPTVTP